MIYSIHHINILHTASAKLEVQCRTALNKTTGKAVIYAEWYIDGLKADIAAVDSYNIIVSREAQHDVPVLLKVIKRVNNITSSVSYMRYWHEILHH